MPKLIDYPRTSYTGAWELAEITDDTGGKCTIETAARKLNRKVSGSFKAIIGSAVKFGLVTSKRELLTTTTLFKRIKHAYDKQEELVFHREAFLTPPLFTQICRKFRSRELPVQMLDVMLIREFGVEEINAQGVAKAFVDGCRMVGLLDEHNTVADIDALNTGQAARRQLASPVPSVNAFRPESKIASDVIFSESASATADPEKPVIENSQKSTGTENQLIAPLDLVDNRSATPTEAPSKSTNRSTDAVANLFGFTTHQPLEPEQEKTEVKDIPTQPNSAAIQRHSNPDNNTQAELYRTPAVLMPTSPTSRPGYQIQISGPGVTTELIITEEDDISLAIALLEKIRRQLKS
ncbi:MAG: hypothetical protein JWP58_1209 [Hymenobacter sp.]|nr:hypothetical protein [Hymenobacter sp.]